MAGYTKLFSSIVHSTIWREPDHVRLVWVTMLALADAQGVVEASVPGLSDVARVSLEQCVEALERFHAPDRWSRNQDRDGRRIETIAGGWRLLNHGRYRDLMSSEQRRERDAERKRVSRASAKCPRASENVRDVSHSEAEASPDTNTEVRVYEGDARGDAPAKPTPPAAIVAPSRPKPSRRQRLPDPFEPNETDVALARELAVNLPIELPKFRDHHTAKGSVMVDWHAALRTWIRNAQKFKAADQQRNGRAWNRDAPPHSEMTKVQIDAKLAEVTAQVKAQMQAKGKP